jgi:3-dehydroquinate synthase
MIGTIQQEVNVRFRYPVHFTRDLFSPNNPLLAHIISDSACLLPAKVLTVVDSGVARSHPGLLRAIEEYAHRARDRLSLVAPPFMTEGGEDAKNDHSHLVPILDAVHHHGLDRQSFLLAIGGGAVLDMVGYAAATAHRGVRLIRVPSTVLSQNDSGVGVKNGINAYGKKNFLGSFAPPHAVFNDSQLLTTLSDRDWLAGASEAVKVALLKDPAFFDFLEESAPALVSRDLTVMERLIHRCAELHLQHIATSGDPFELGSSRPLDFGHWAAHKLEQLSGYRVRHGEAVAVGISLDASYAYLQGMLRESEWIKILRLFEALRLPVYHPLLSRSIGDRTHPECILRGLEEFREHLGGRLTVMLLEGIGKPLEVNRMDEDVVAKAVGLLANRRTGKGVAA